MFFLVLVLSVYAFLLVHTFVDFGVPLPPRARLVPLLVDVVVIFARFW